MVDVGYINITLQTDRTQDHKSVIQDLRIPNGLTVKQLLVQLIDAMGSESIDLIPDERNVIRVVNKAIVLSDDDVLSDYPITNGDVIEVL